MSILDTLITDRTAQDVDELYTLLSQGQNPPEGHKGAYNASDLNRVGEAVNYLKEKLCEVGIQSDPSEFEEVYDYQELSGPLVSFESNVQSPLNKLVATVSAVQAGSGTPSSTNIRAISGWEGAKVTRCGKNLWDFERWLIRNGISFSKTGNSYTFTSAFVLYSDFFEFSGFDVTVNVFMRITQGTGTNQGVVFFNKNGQPVTGRITGNTMNVVASKLRLDFSSPGSLTIEAPMVCLASILDTSFAPYIRNTIDVVFPPSAGPVYGGLMNITSGELMVTHDQIASYAGEALPGAWISDRDVYTPGASPSSGAQVVYELASPLIYQLTPYDLMTVAEYNNIWADTGDVYAEFPVSVDIKIKDEAKSKTDWDTTDIQTQSHMKKYLDAIWSTWVAVMAYRPEIELPEKIRFLDYIGANQIEELLKQTEIAVTRIELSYRQYSGRHISGVNCLP